jgi:hypothetical protein
MSQNFIEKLIQMADRERARWRPKARGWHPAIMPTSLFIRNYLQLKGEAYPFEIYRTLEYIRKERLGIHVGSPINFYKYIWTLEHLGLIERTGRVEPAFRGGTESRLPRRLWRTYYRLVPRDRVPRPEKYDEWWLNPQKAMGEVRGWKIRPK